MDLRIPPLCAKSGSNRGFSQCIFISTFLNYGHIIFSKMLVPNSNYIFLYFSNMIHACDVINLNVNKGVQKTFSRDHFEMVRKKHHFHYYSWFWLIKYMGFGYLFSQNSIRRSGNRQKVKNCLQGQFEAFQLEMIIFELISLNVKFLRGFGVFCCLSVDESRDMAINIF